MSDRKRISTDEAQRVGDALGIDWDAIELDQFQRGMDVELEHGSMDPHTDVTHDDPIATGKIALAHLQRIPDYYDRLAQMLADAEADWAERNEAETGFQHDL